MRSQLLPRWFRHGERAVESIEFVGLFPLVIMTIAIAWQFLLVGYTGIIVVGAAREVARTAAVHGCGGAAENTLHQTRAGLTVSEYRCVGSDQLQITVSLEVPSVPIPFLENLDYPSITSTTITRYERGYSR